jgi:hypothetical protein
MYKIIGNDQQEYGPVTSETLRQWIAEGRANANTLVQPEGGAEWQPLGTVIEFAAALTSTSAGGKTPTLSPASPSVPTHLTPAILTTLCCCLPVGIVAIVYAAQVNSKLAGGDYEGAQAASKNAKTWCWIALVLGLVVIAVQLAFTLPIAIPNFMSARSAAQRNACISNLRMLDGATAQWALENKKEEGAPVTMGDLKPYLRGQSLPTCPANGTYSVSKVGEPPHCTIPGHQLNFPGLRPLRNQGDRQRPNPGPRPRPSPRDQPERDRP